MGSSSSTARSYAIGDVHGHLDKLLTAHAFIEADRERTGDDTAPVIHVGDYCDRGPDTRGVLNHLISGQACGQPWICLLGNHDRLMRMFLNDPSENDPVFRGDMSWLHPAGGGLETLRSYGVSIGPDPEAMAAEARDRVPQDHIDFLQSLPASLRRGDTFFCHAGVRPGVPLGDQDEDDLVWIRDEFLLDDTDHGALIVHGHTPVDEATHYGNRVSIDSAAAFGGPVSAIVIEDGDVALLTASGRVALHPVAAFWG